MTTTCRVSMPCNGVFLLGLGNVVCVILTYDDGHETWAAFQDMRESIMATLSAPEMFLGPGSPPTPVEVRKHFLDLEVEKWGT